MNAIGKSLGLVFLCASFVYGATDATISGTVKDPRERRLRALLCKPKTRKPRFT